jgi:hypothetical protein
MFNSLVKRKSKTLRDFFSAEVLDETPNKLGGRRSLNHAHSIRIRQALLSRGDSALLEGKRSNIEAIYPQGNIKRTEGGRTVVCYR